MERFAPVFKALAEPSRLKIVGELLHAPRHVGELVRLTGLGQSLVSHHLKVLRAAGVVTSGRRGPFVYYSLAQNGVRGLLESATAWGGPCGEAGADDDAKLEVHDERVKGR
jgi:DNA-binding transcriptional ArsR family regulator